MRKIIPLIATALITILLTTFGPVTGTVSARGINSNVGTSAFPFLKINIGARASGMAGAFTGMADDESALYYNPSGIAFLEGKRFILEYHNYFADLQSGFVGIIRPVWGTRCSGYQSIISTMAISSRLI